MLDFKKLDFSNAIKLLNYFRLCNYDICDKSVGSLLIWNSYYNTEFAINDDTLYLKYNLSTKKTVFTLPISKDGSINLAPIKEYAKSLSLNVVTFGSMSEFDIDFFTKKFPQSKLTFNQKWSDYVYNASDLAFLSGKKYHGQKNFVNRFNKTYKSYKVNFNFVDNLDKIESFLLDYYKNTKKDARLFNVEKAIIFDFIKNFDKIGQEGIILEVDDKIVAIAFGERINDYFFVHFEKADTSYIGSYQKIVNEFSKKLYNDGVKFINREDDAGDDGLRKSKQSYHPVKMANKYFADTLIEDL